MGIDYLRDHLWLSTLILALLYSLDYFLTIKTSLLYKKQKHIEYQSGIELNPRFNKAVAEARWFNKKWLMYLIFLILFNIFFFETTNSSNITTYEFILGSFILSEIFVVSRHVQNINLFNSINVAGAVEGRIIYGRTIMHKNASAAALAASVSYLIFYLFTFRTFFLGGALTLMFLAIIQKSWEKKIAKIG